MLLFFCIVHLFAFHSTFFVPFSVGKWRFVCFSFYSLLFASFLCGSDVCAFACFIIIIIIKNLTQYSKTKDRSLILGQILLAQPLARPT